MKAYKIKNLTNSFGKREMMYNTDVIIEYYDSMEKKSLTIKPGDTTYLKIRLLPSDVHRMRIKGIIDVLEISEKEFNIMNDQIKISTTIKIDSIKSNKEKVSKDVLIDDELGDNRKKSKKG